MNTEKYGYWNEFPEDWVEMRRRHWSSYWVLFFEHVASLFGIVSILFIFIGTYLPKSGQIAGIISIGLFILSMTVQFVFTKINDSTYNKK
jgi:hypothetical protein